MVLDMQNINLDKVKSYKIYLKKKIDIRTFSAIEGKSNYVGD
jgi:hypothetical protein